MQIVKANFCAKNMQHHMGLVFLLLLLLLVAPDAVSPPTAVSYASALEVTWDPPVR